MEVYYPWRDNAHYVEDECGCLVDWREGFYICPECGEPIYECDWNSHQLVRFICPICEWEGD